MKGRKLVIGTDVWRWRVGKSNVVAKNEATGETRHISFSRLTGVSPDDIERAQWKGTPFHIMPGQVTRWLTLGSDTFTATDAETYQATSRQ